MKFIDGSNNSHVIKTEFIEYSPVKPEFSSSGAYDGGEPVKKKITQIE